MIVPHTLRLSTLRALVFLTCNGADPAVGRQDRPALVISWNDVVRRPRVPLPVDDDRRNPVSRHPRMHRLISIAQLRHEPRVQSGSER